MQVQALPPAAQLLLYRDHGSTEIQDAFDIFIRYLNEHKYDVSLVKETAEYRLYNVKRLELF
jgi:hypothetical protein